MSESSSMVVAGRTISNPLAALVDYGLEHHATVAGYDLAPRGDPMSLTREEVGRTRIIASRISNGESDWFVKQARTAPWADVAPDAGLASADPGVRGSLYDLAGGLYEHFRTGAPWRVSVAKIHKVLHLKRPGLIPILDSHLMKAYRRPAKDAAARYPELSAKRLYWAAIRDDLVLPQNVKALVNLRCDLAMYQHSDIKRQGKVRALTQLSDLRLIDALAW